MVEYKPKDLRNASLAWFVLGQFLYYQSEKHNLLCHTYIRIFKKLVNSKGAPNV